MDIGILACLVGILGLAFALGLFLNIVKKPAGNQTMKDLSAVIHRGAMVFLKKEYSILVFSFLWSSFYFSGRSGDGQLWPIYPGHFVPCWPGFWG